MGETNKQVRVDNWGIFFLQRLQLFFNRTDYCDLTLQFEGNVQLKVHRLVMNACTEYFNILEQTCEVVDGNTIIMPDDLQADVILPIVNFMYTGMLEFQMSLFDKLYRTADIMNIPILTKLLDAQKKPIPPLPKSQSKRPQPTWNLHGKKITPKVENELPATLPGRKLPVWKRKSIPVPPPPVTSTQYYSEPKKAPQDPLALFDNTPKPTRFEWPEDEINTTFNLMENSFDDISYTSKPLLTQDDELRASTSFEEVKHTPSVNKRTSKDYSPSIDVEEVKNYVKEQKIRSDMTEYDDEDDPDNYLESVNTDKDSKRKASKPMSPVNTKRVRFSVSEKENTEAKINVTATGKAPEMDHTKIISEVLKKYPHLVKKNKNIRLKILAKSPTKPESPKNQNTKTPTSKIRVQVASPKSSPRSAKVSTGELTKGQDEGPWVCTRCSSNEEQVEFVLYYLYRKHMTDVHNEKFDSRMCKFCGHQSSKHNMLMYHQYTRHGIKPPPAYNFPKCNRCPYIALTENLLIKHKLNHTKFDLQCLECKVAFNSQASLLSHMQITGHSGKSGRHNYDCQYCTKRYHSGSNLFSHIKMVHRDEARRDGIVSIDEKDEIEEDQLEEEIEEYIVPSQADVNEKVNILSDIKVPINNSESTNQSQTEQTSVVSTPSTTHGRETTSTSNIDNVTSGIATSLGLVDIVVLDENQQYILHNDQQLVTQQSLTNEQREYIIPEMTEEHSFAQAQNINQVITSEHSVITQSILNNSDIASTDELVMVLTDHDYNDGNNEILSTENSNIVVLYSHPVDGQQNQFITSQGNLMLNSQTGMLEIRNNDPHGVNNSQDAQIESIEMIQREINSHNMINTTTQDDNTVQTSTSFEESLPQNTEMLENEFSSNAADLMQNKEREEDAQVEATTSEDIDMDRMISLADKPIKRMDSEVLVLNDCLSGNSQEEPMEIDEECSVQENQNENKDIAVQETLSSEQQSSSSFEHHEEVSGKSMPEIDVVTEDVVSEHQAHSMDSDTIQTNQEENSEDVPNEGVGFSDNTNNEIDLDENVNTVNANEDTANKGALDSTEAGSKIPEAEVQTFEKDVECELAVEETENRTASEETVDDQALENTVDNTNVETTLEEVTDDNRSQSSEKSNENSKENEEKFIEINQQQCVTEEFQEMESQHTEEEGTIEEIHQSEELVTTKEVDGNELTEKCNADLLAKEQYNMSEAKKDSEGEQETTENLEEIVPNVEEQVVETEEIHTECENEDKEQVVEGLPQTEKDISVEFENSNCQIEENISQPQVEDITHSQNEEAEPTVEINLQTEEVSSQMDEAVSQIDEENCSAHNDSADEKLQEEISQTDEKVNLEEEEQMIEEGVTSADENSQSQDSQTSQCSSRQEELISELKKDTSQATKISILNDWEDTEDSQQSDNVSKKAEITVNKLIHDWDDDEEEGHESES